MALSFSFVHSNLHLHNMDKSFILQVIAICKIVHLIFSMAKWKVVGYIRDPFET